jgi:hypothetical protein
MALSLVSEVSIRGHRGMLRVTRSEIHDPHDIHFCTFFGKDLALP